jgi:hypothetical protein
VIWGEWQNPALTRCDSKLAFRSLNQAAVQAERASNRTGELIIAYTCFDCGAFHIGHADAYRSNQDAGSAAKLSRRPRSDKLVPIPSSRSTVPPGARKWRKRDEAPSVGSPATTREERAASKSSHSGGREGLEPPTAL